MLGLTSMPAFRRLPAVERGKCIHGAVGVFVFRENFDRRIALGMAAIVAGL
jgi:hypothetical protein